MMKWIWILSGLVLLIIGGVYVNRHLPEWMIKGGLAYVQKTDYALILESDKVSLDTDQKAVAKDVLQTMTYDEKGTRLLGDEAFVTVEVTLVDLMQLIVDEKEAIFKNTLADWKQTLNDLFNQRIEGVVIRQLALVLEQTSEKPMTTVTIEVPFVREYLWWKPVMTKEWIEAIVHDYLTHE